MSAHDPKWIGLALKAYDACLPLYPREVREAHGEEMRQAFRDRCREVARGQRGAWQWFGEIAPDLIGSAARAHMHESGRSDARLLPGLMLLGLLAAALATQARWSPAILDQVKAAEFSWKMWREAREYKHRDELLAEANARLVAQGDPESMAVAALVHRGLFEQTRWYMLPVTEGNFEQGLSSLRFPREGEIAAELAGSVATRGGSPASLALAALACEGNGACNDLAIHKLVSRDPDNAYGWMLAFRRAQVRRNAAGMQEALDGVARAKTYESHAATAHALLIGAMTPAQRADAEAMRRAGEHLSGLRWLGINGPGGLLFNCSFRPRSPNNPAVPWIDSHPEARGACLHLAVLMANSTDVVTASYGWRQLLRAGVPLTSVQASAARDAVWQARQQESHFGINRGRDHRSYTEWSASDWQRWHAAWAPGDGERAALARWLPALGVPLHAPAGPEGDVRD